MSAIGPPPRVAVIIATCDRRGLLSDRAVPSVVGQTRAPDFLVIVDDSCPDARPSNAQFVAGLALPRCAVAYLENARTAGASGSWNTALDFLTAEAGDAGDLFVALLDDDDSWHSEYLASCHAAASARRLDMVACDIRRIEDETVAPVVSEAPASLRVNEVLTGNPGIQGSNLFVRLSVLLAAGGFDEALRSTTDRDLCIRIGELGTVRYGRLPSALVDHFADPDRSRLSARGSAAKLEGLTAFWRKYVGRMTLDQRSAFLERASTLFGWSPPSDINSWLACEDAPKEALVPGLLAEDSSPTELPDALREHSDIRPRTPFGFEHMARRAFLACRHAAHLDLPSLMRQSVSDDRLRELPGYAGFRAQTYSTSSSPVVRNVSLPGPCVPPVSGPIRLYVSVITSDPATLRGLLDGLASVRLGGTIDRVAVVVLDNGSPPGELDAVVRGARERGLELAVVCEARQRLDAAKGAFGGALSDRPKGQVGIAQARTMVQRYLGTLLVEDPGSFGWVLDDDIRLDARTSKYLAWLPAFRERGTDVLITGCQGSSPNPPLHGLRVQLVDLVHNIQWLRSLPIDSALPDRSAENRALRERYPDYYYDLSRKHTAHLEFPHWLEPAFEGESVRVAYSRLLDSAFGLLSGVPLTRPVVAAPPADPLGSAIDSVNRGGSTFILNHRALSETPNTIMRVNGREARRSDMIWAIVNRYYRGMTIRAVPFPLHHVGRVTAVPSINIEKVQGEVVGSSFYAALSEFLQARPHHSLDFSREESLDVKRLAKQNRSRRWHMLDQNCRRIIGLAQALRALARPGELQELLEHLSRWFTPETLAEIRVGVETDDDMEIVEFLASLRPAADDFAIARADVGFIRSQLRDCDAGTCTVEVARNTLSGETSGGAR